MNDIERAARALENLAGQSKRPSGLGDDILICLGDAKAAIRALAPQQEGWRPISEAPLDGTDIDLWVVNELGEQYRIPSCYWSETRKQWHGPDEWIWADYERPTHFMPFPAPPEE